MVLIWLIKRGYFIKSFLSYIKMSEFADLTYYQNNEVWYYRAKDYYESDKERLREQARDRYRTLSEEETNKKREYGKNRYHNMAEEKRTRLKEYQKNYCKAKKVLI